MLLRNLKPYRANGSFIIPFLAPIVILAACGQEAPKNSVQPQAEKSQSYKSADYQQGWISVRQYGVGPDVILIPGLASSAEVWNETVAELSNDYRLHVVQVAGFAGAPPSEESRDKIVQGLSEDIAIYIKDQKLETPVIAGHSLGGFTALNIAHDFPSSLSRAIVVDSLPFYSALFNPAATVETSRPQAEAMTAQMRQLPKSTYDKRQARTARIFAKGKIARARITKDGASSDRDVVLNSMFELMTTDMRPKLGNIEAPVSVIYAHDAKMGMPAMAMTQLYEAQYNGLTNVSLTRIDDSFHFIMDDQADEFYASIRKELKR